MTLPSVLDFALGDEEPTSPGSGRILLYGKDGRWYTLTSAGRELLGRGIKAIARTAGNGQPGTTDVYTVTLDDDTVAGTFSVLNGPVGPRGFDGWEPVLATVADGERRVLQLVDWTGGEGTKPAIPTNTYLGPTGLTTLASATDLRGATGQTGPAATLSSTTPLSLGTASAGTSGAAARGDHRHDHGNQAGGALHAAATTTVAGFMAASDKAKLDGVAAGATNNVAATAGPQAVASTPSVGTSAAYAREDHAHQGVASLAAGAGVSVSAAVGAITIANTDTGSAARAQIEARIGAANGIAPLGPDQTIPALFLPSYVDDVLEFDTLAALPAVGDRGKIYVTTSTDKQYRWSGSAYRQISESPGSTDAVPEGPVNQYFTVQRVRETALAGLSVATNAVIQAADTVLTAFGKLQAQISAISTFLAGADPFPQYATTAEASAAASSAVTAHEGLADPHPQYLTSAEAQALIPTAKLSAAISTLFTSAANSTAVQEVVGLDIPANYLTTARTFNFRLEGTQSQSAAATNVVVAIFVDGTQLAAASVAGGTAAQTNRAINAEGSVTYNGSTFFGGVTNGVSGVLPVSNSNVTGVAAAANTTHRLSIRVQTSTANAANIIRAASAYISQVH